MAAKKKIDDRNKPWVANYPPLKAWLDKHGARCLWQEFRENLRSVECWQMSNGLTCIVVVFADRLGWDIYTSNQGTAIGSTLIDAEKRLQIGEKG